MLREFPTANVLRLALFVALTGSAVGRAAPPEAPSPGAAGDAPFVRALEAFDRARSGDTNATEPAIAAFEALVRIEPQQPVYAAYLGSALTLKGRDAWMPWNKMRYVDQGTDRIDAALAALKPEHERRLLRGVPVSLETRFVAATTFIKIPDAIFHRRADGKKLLAGILRDPELVAAPLDFRAGVHFAAAEVARQEERSRDEADQLKQALALVGAGTAADRARARLKEIGQ
jgi:hypothetical protein